jgi:hypothetical protein
MLAVVMTEHGGPDVLRLMRTRVPNRKLLMMRWSEWTSSVWIALNAVQSKPTLP